MDDANVLERVERLDLILPQIIRRMQRIPTRPGAPPSLSLPQLRMMALLEMEGASTMGELARRASVTLPTATSSIKALVARRCVSRRRAKHDRRVIIVNLTAKGRKLLEGLYEQRRERFRTLLSRLEPREQARFVDAFEAILDVLRKLDEAEPSSPAGDASPEAG